MYTFNSRVRYSEVGNDKLLNLTSIINYFQDCSTFHSEALNMGFDYLHSIDRAWVLNSWQIVINKYPSLGDSIKVGTWAYDFKAFYGWRNFLLMDDKDKVLAAANSIWVLMDTLNNRPAKATKELTAYEIKDPYDMEYAPRKIKLPKETIELPQIEVQKSFIDLNNHVNNGQYVKIAEEFLPPSFRVSQMRAEYKKAAVLGDLLFPKISTTDDHIYTVALTDIKENPYVIVEFKGNNKNERII